MFLSMRSPLSLPTAPAAAEQRDIYTVARLNREAKALLEGSFPLLWIEGEISNLARPGSGHLYFSLKDDQAQVRCALFRGSQRGLTIQPRDGMHVLVRARVSLYEGRGEFQLIVDYLEEAGEGALRRAFELLKNRLAGEGLFDPAHKKPLPRLPKRIGVITSPTGAAIRDILTTLKRRFPAIPVLVYPVPVQGEGAAEKIAATLRLAVARGDCDALILARGGGSLEDLWAFNAESVARAIHASPIPVVVGVGHETDYTIADLAADARAPTPTAAAELLSPDQHEWLAEYRYREQRLVRLIRDRLREHAQRLDWLAARVIHPRERLGRLTERLRALAHRLRLAENRARHAADARLRVLGARLMRQHPAARLREQRLRLSHVGERLVTGLRQAQSGRDRRLELAARRLDALSPLATLGRGYAIVQRATDAAVVRDAGTLTPGEALHVRLARGGFGCRVEEIDADAE
jgi:exodeoxyribonuclease VII large subunit